MIYLQEGNFPLNEAFSSEIIQEANSTYQLTFKLPTSDPKWASLTPETELVADDLHGEQYFTIFEVEKQHGYITIYANQVATLLNGYSINKINVDRVNGATVMNALVAGFKRETPFTFFSDVMSKHTLNLKDISAMEALVKDKHSIVGQWGGDLVRDKYSVRLLEHGGIENESLFAYKKNMKSFQESKSTKELRTRIHFKKVIEAHEEGKKDQILTVTIDSPLITKYKHIYEADMEVQDQDVVDQKTLEEYGKRYFRETLCDMIEESLEIDVVGQADQPVHIFDIVSIFHEIYNVDLRKKITKYKFNPMSNKLVSIGFGEVTRTLADSISGIVNDSVDKKMKTFDAEYEAKVQKLVDNANAEYDKQSKELEHKITDGIEQAKAQAEVVKQEISGTIDQKISGFKQSTDLEIEKAKAKADEALKKAGASADLGQEAKEIANVNVRELNAFKTNVQIERSKLSDELKRYSREETTNQITAIREQFTNGYVAKSTYVENVESTKQRFEALTRDNEAKLADFRQGIDGRLTTLSSQIANKVNNIDFQKVKESSLLYERILGNSEADAPDKLSRLVMSSEIFQTEVGKYAKDDFNLVYDPTNFSKWKKKQSDANVVEVIASTKLLRITNSGKANSVYHGFALPLNTSTFTEGEKISYRFEAWVDVLPDAPLGIELWSGDGVLASDRVYFDKTGIQIITGTLTVNKTTTNSREFPLEFWLMKNGQVAIGKVSLVRGDRPPNKFVDSAAVQGIATQTQVTQLADSWSVRNLNSNGDVLNSINLLANGTNRIDGRLTHITGQTLIDNAVIKSAMVGKLKTGNFESGSVTTQIIASNAVTADKLLVDLAMINKLVSNQAFIKELTSKKAFITQLASIDISAERIKGGKLSSLNGVTDFDLQTGWIDMNTEAVGIRNRFNGKPMQFLVFGQGEINGVPCAYTQLMSNRNGTTGIEHTSAGIQIWNGRQGSNIQTAITFYGKSMDFSPSSIAGGVSLDTEQKVLFGLENVFIKNKSLVALFNNIDYNFQQIVNHFKQNDLGWPSQYRINI